MAKDIPPPNNDTESFAFTYAAESPAIDIKELRYLVVKELLSNKKIVLYADPNQNYGKCLEDTIIPAAVRIEAYINDGK